MYDNQTLDTVHAKALCFLYKLKKKKESLAWLLTLLISTNTAQSASKIMIGSRRVARADPCINGYTD